MLAKKTLNKKRARELMIRLLSCLMAGVFLLTTSGVSYAFHSDRKAALVASAFVDIDTDKDGLGDTWEKQYFGSITAYDGDDDPDGDGYDNLWEYQHGTDPTDPDDPNYYLAMKRNALTFLKSMMDRRVSSGMRILYSYVDRSGNTEGYGWAYDNAVSILALGNAGEWQRAKEALDAFIWFQDRDPIGDGRIRSAYWANKPIDILHAGDCGPWIPSGNAEAQDQSVGDMAFMILAALRYHEYIGGADTKYLSFAKKLGDWIYDNAKSDKGLSGYNMARQNYELADPASYDRKSTENNIDCYAAFIKLYEALNDHNYRAYALHAKNFVLSMWNKDRGMFWTGTLDDGATINGGAQSDITGKDFDPTDPTSGQPADVNTWALMALGEKDKYGAGINWVEAECRVTGKDGFAFGYDFNSDRDGIWFEGMSHTALAYQMLATGDKSEDILDVIREAQDAGTGGVMCASHDGVTTSFGTWTLSDDLHTAPSAWLAFAVDGYNPFWNQPIADAIPYEGGYNEDGDRYIFEEPWAEAAVADIAPATDGTARAMVGLTGTGEDDKGTPDTSDDGKIVKYEWDFDGKGTFDWSSTTTGNAQYWYTEVGSHLARFRVTNDNGHASIKGVAFNITAADLGGGAAPPVASGVSASVASGTAPFAVTFTGAASDSDGYVAGYEWDFDGDGEYDSYSDSSGNVTYVYRQEGTYAPTFRVTDNDGLTDTAALAIEVKKAKDAPKAKAMTNDKVGTAPYEVVFDHSKSSGDITRYEWDFDSDGAYDWMALTAGMITYTYGEPGTYYAKLKVTDRNGICDTDTVKIRVKDNKTQVYPESAGTASPASGIIPFDSLFNHSLSIGLITNYEWDFEGNKHYDISTGSANNVVHTYSRPGYYLAALRVWDKNGLSSRSYLPIVATGPDQAGAVYASYIKTPQSGQRIYGNSVTFSAAIAPGNKNQKVNLEYKLTTAGNTDWASGASAAPYPYRTAIDATKLLAGDYDFRASVNNITDKAKTTPVTVDAVDWDIHEGTNGNGERIKKVKVSKDEDAQIELLDGTGCTVPAGALLSDNLLTITVPNGSGRLINDSVNTILYHREFTLENNGALNKPITVIIPYKDADNDGTVDDLNIREEDLDVYVYNEPTPNDGKKDSERWEALSGFIVYPDENYVSGTVSHLSTLGLGTIGGGAAVVGAIAGGIGALGGGGRSCFIATATYGTPMAFEVQALRDFRDAYLLTNKPGEFVIDMYEKYSPPIARVIAENEFLKGVARHYLTPVIKFARFVNAFSCLKANKVKGAGCDD